MVFMLGEFNLQKQSNSKLLILKLNLRSYSHKNTNFSAIIK